jgi:phage terminase large subunit-like protein
MRRIDYRGHPRALIDAWFLPEEDLARYDPKLYWFDPDAATRVLDFFKLYCTHVEGEWAGKPLIPEQWQYQTLRDAFGWKNVSDGTRKYRLIWVAVPRKNAKSTTGAGVGLYLTLADQEPGAKVFSVATEEEQALIIFNLAAAMVKASPELSGRVELFKRSMYVEKTGAIWQALSGNPKKSGKNASGILYDEVHEAADRKLWDIMKTSTIARRQPMTWAATTAGFDENTICYELHDTARKVRDGIFDLPTLLPVIFEADEKKEDWTSEETWRKCNPMYGISVKVAALREDCELAKKTPAYQNTFKRLRLNIWTRQMELWMPKDRWDECSAEFPIEPLDGQKCFCGLDLSTVEDLAAFAKVWPVLDQDTGEFHFFAQVRLWLPRENVRKKEDLDAVPYQLWAEQGFVTLTEGNYVDYDFIRTAIVKDGERYDIKEIAVDRWNAAQIITQLTGDGFTMAPFGQGFASMAGPTKQLMDTVLKRTLHHGGNPVIDWMASNVAVETDAAGNWKPNKAASRKRIDGIVALIMALGRASLHLDSGASVYDSRGLITI